MKSSSYQAVLADMKDYLSSTIGCDGQSVFVEAKELDNPRQAALVFRAHAQELAKDLGFARAVYHRPIYQRSGSGAFGHLSNERSCSSGASLMLYRKEA